MARQRDQDGGLFFLEHLDLQDNFFLGPPSEVLVTHCATEPRVCPGLPPISCSAYGPSWRLKLTETGQCLRCPPFAVTIVLVSFIVALWLLGLAVLYRLNKLIENLKERLKTVRFDHSSLLFEPADRLRCLIDARVS